MSPTRTFSVLLAGAAVVCAGLGLVRGNDVAHVAQRGSIATPLWSPRRVPQPLVDAVGGQRLQAALDTTVGGLNACFVVDQGGAPLAVHELDTPVTPASTEKLLTSAVALEVIGADARLETRAVAPSPPDGGTIDRLYLVGGGDPLLVTPDVQALRDQNPELRGTKTSQLTALADAIVAAGVKRIPGGIVGDDSRYEALRYVATWPPDDRTDGQIGPMGALTVNGGFSAIKPRIVPVSDPALYAADQLGQLLAARGVSVGPSSRGTAPAGAVEVAKLDSPTIAELVAEMLTTSDNLAAELLTREIGVRVSQQGTTVAGTQAVAAKLQALGLPVAGLVLNDGSGLDHGNRVTCRLLASVLNLGSQPKFAVLWSGLPVAGQTGTLARELNGTPLDGKARAKTGTLTFPPPGVSGLVGFIDVGHPLRFAFVANGPFSQEGAVGLRDQFATIAGGFPDAPPADALVPRPAANPAGTKP